MIISCFPQEQKQQQQQSSAVLLVIIIVRMYYKYKSQPSPCFPFFILQLNADRQKDRQTDDPSSSRALLENMNLLAVFFFHFYSLSSSAFPLLFFQLLHKSAS
jgi:hypothetical protein